MKKPVHLRLIEYLFLTHPQPELKIVRVTPGGWSHQVFVRPVTVGQKYVLRLRGWRPMSRICLAGRIGYWVHDKYRFDYAK